jgi:ABC-type Zn uptake system ZnuABC Zn-binding protein ZnuA
MKLIFVTLFFSLFFSLSCFARDHEVVTSFSILKDVVENITPSHLKVKSIVPAGMDSHGYQAMAQDYLTFKKADLIILVGANFDFWATQMIEKVKSPAQIYYVTKNLSLLKTNDHEHTDSKFDPHFWQSPEIMTQAIQSLSEVLQKKYPDSKDEIKQKTNTYIDQIRHLQTRFRFDFSKVPLKDRHMVVAHNAFQYFSQEFSIQVDSPLDTSQESESSIQKISSLIKKIKSEKIKSLFLEKSSPENLIKSISQETKVPISGTLYSDCLSESPEASTYLKMLDYNFSLILKSMKGSTL